MSNKKKALEEKARLDYNPQVDAHNPLNVANAFEENEIEEDTEFKYTNDQTHILDVMENKIQSGKQMLSLAHGAAGATKSVVMQKKNKGCDEY